MDKVLRNSIIASILIVSFSVAFYFVYYLPDKQRKLEAARKDCSQQAEDLLAKNQGILKQQGGGEALIKVNDFIFDKCLREKGLIN